MQPVCLFLFLVFTAMQLVSAGDHTVVRNVHGIVGGSVHMRCVLEPPCSVHGLYMQKTDSNGKEIFINGFYKKVLNVDIKYKNRTIINDTDLSMEMHDLSLDDEGWYTCILFHESVKLNNQTKFHLTVTANYSVPAITVQGCGRDPAAQNCVIGCSSSGGFPRSNVTWSVVGDETSSLLQYAGDTEFSQDPQSRLWNVSHVVTLNCSRLLNITCSVGGVMSPAVSLCLSVPVHAGLTIPVACAVLLLVSFAIVALFVMKCRTTQPSAELSTDAELATLKSDWMSTAKHTLSENLN